MSEQYNSVDDIIYNTPKTKTLRDYGSLYNKQGKLNTAPTTNSWETADTINAVTDVGLGVAGVGLGVAEQYYNTALQDQAKENAFKTREDTLFTHAENLKLDRERLRQSDYKEDTREMLVSAQQRFKRFQQSLIERQAKLSRMKQGEEAFNSIEDDKLKTMLLENFYKKGQKV